MKQKKNKPNIIMLCSLDTKAAEAHYLKSCIEDQGANTILMDIGYGQPSKMSATYSARDLAIAAGTDIDAIYAMNDTSKASELMKQGAIIRVQELFLSGHCDGIISFGGSSNTTLATGVMKTLPIGIPKMMISSSAAMPAYSALYFGSRDITIMNAIVDISGLNDLTRAFLKRGAGGIYGMVSASDGKIDSSSDNKIIAVSSFRFAETCSQLVMAELERLGYTAIPFSAQGVGENAMENLVAQGFFDGVVDIVPAGLSEQMLGGNRAARPDRLEAAAKGGIPQVVAPSGFDMISCGPIERRDSGDALWQKLGIASRQYVVPDQFRVETRTSAVEVAEIGKLVASKLNMAKGPASIMVPKLGWSSLSVEGRDLYNLEADAAFVPALKNNLNQNVSLFEIDADLNSETFAHAMVNELHGMIEAQ